MENTRALAVAAGGKKGKNKERKEGIEGGRKGGKKNNFFNKLFF